MTARLEVRGLMVSFPVGGRAAAVVRGASLAVARGEIVGLVGESGSGKTLTALAVLGLVPEPGHVDGGSIRLDGEELRSLAPAALRRIRGGEIGMIFQEPSAALNPVLSIGAQVAEVVRAHGRETTRREARLRAVDLLRRVGLADPERRYGAYPHELSGGQRQRVVIALALAGSPRFLLADEPTAALDMTLQAEILDLLRELRTGLGLGILLISHDLGVVAEVCDRIYIFYAGEIVEEGSVAEVFERPSHPYTLALLAVTPRAGGQAGRLGSSRKIPGQVPSPAELPPGCSFHPRCAERFARCEREEPPWIEIGAGRGVRCFARSGPPPGTT